jgi:hypothetical protein
MEAEEIGKNPLELFEFRQAMLLCINKFICRLTRARAAVSLSLSLSNINDESTKSELLNNVKLPEDKHPGKERSMFLFENENRME